MNSAEMRQAIDLRTPRAAGVSGVGVDEDCPSGAAAAFALLATMATAVGVLAGALLF
jgi:hypothetical protein